MIKSMKTDSNKVQVMLGKWEKTRFWHNWFQDFQKDVNRKLWKKDPWMAGFNILWISKCSKVSVHKYRHSVEARTQRKKSIVGGGITGKKI